MADTTRTDTPAEAEGAAHGHHPTQSEYVRIAVVLAILTALEVSTYYFDFGSAALPLLIALMAIKFVMVAGFFMHLRFDTKLFGRFLYTGLAWAVVLYTLTLLVFVVDANQ